MPRGNIPVEALCCVLREHGYTFKRQADRVMIWKQPGNHVPANLPRTTFTNEDRARGILRHVGMTFAEIENFITNHRKVG
jgi:hypothetical protein